MAGYSGTSLVQKLGIKPGYVLGLCDPPAGFPDTLKPMPEQVVIKDATRARGPFQVIVAFTTSERALARVLPALRDKLDPSGGLWVAWPKRASGVVTDLTEDVVRRIGIANTLVDNKVCAIDEVWSGLRLVVRVADRPKPKMKPSRR